MRSVNLREMLDQFLVEDPLYRQEALFVVAGVVGAAAALVSGPVAPLSARKRFVGVPLFGALICRIARGATR